MSRKPPIPTGSPATPEELADFLEEQDAFPGLPPADGDAVEVRLRERLLAEAGGMVAYKAAFVERMRPAFAARDTAQK